MACPTSPSPDSVLRDRAFLHLLLGRLTATLATQIQSVVVGWQLYEMTRDPLTLGWAGLAQFLPMALLVLPAGDAADRLPRRLILAASWLTQASAGVLFLLLTVSGTRSPIGFFAVLILFGMARAFAGPGMQSLLPQLVGEARLPRAIAQGVLTITTAPRCNPKLGQTRRVAPALAIPRPSRATPYGAILGRNPKGRRLFFRNPALQLAHVARLHHARCALSCEKIAAGAASR